MSKNPFNRIDHNVEVCVIGGGMAGVCAALAAARQGSRVALVHDRPMPGGNSSSECRLKILGADRHNEVPNMRETGILEELRLEDLRRNPAHNFSVWDMLLYEKLRFEPNITLLLNCSCIDAAMDGDSIASITGWQLTTQTNHVVHARVFIDCSGDGILAPLTGAAHRVGREGRDEFGESLAPEQPDRKVLGMTCFLNARKHDKPQIFEPPPWAYKFDDCDQLPRGIAGHCALPRSYWWIELGGNQDCIADTEDIRDELLKILMGVWDHVKNRCPHREHAADWAIDWLQFLPGKRESRRYVGLHVLTQQDVQSQRHFEDVVCHGGWPIDAHDPDGFWAAAAGRPIGTFHLTPSPFEIPLRSLCSANVHNLMFAGRTASCSHIAFCATRVMGTCSVSGQAAGTAAAMATRLNIMPGGLMSHLPELQQRLLRDDVFLPGVRQDLPAMTEAGKLSVSRGDGEPLRDGFNRTIGQTSHYWLADEGDWAEYRFDKPQQVAAITLILDSALDEPMHEEFEQLPPQLPRDIRLEAEIDGGWRTIQTVRDCSQRLIHLPVNTMTQAVRFVLERTWGGKSSRVFGFYLE